jgi:hypothetical protein
MSLEHRLSDALHSADDYQPSPDLFARVERSLEEDLAHRRRVGRVVAGAAAALVFVIVYLGLFVSRTQTGALTIPSWSIETLETLVLVGLTLVLGPSIRRFGRTYVVDVFRLEPETGLKFLILLDIAFYLFFSGLILLGVDFAAVGSPVFLQTALADSAGRLAFFLLSMGGLHGLTLALLPLVGLIHSSLVRRARRREAGPAAPTVTKGAAQAERVVRIIVWGVAVLVVLGLVLTTGIAIGIGFGS